MLFARLLVTSLVAIQSIHPIQSQSQSPAASSLIRTPQSSQCSNEKQSFLWRVRRKGPYPPSYLFGTIHVPYTLVWDHVPLIVKHYFQQASFIYFELDLTDPYTLAALNHCQFLPRGERLNDTLPASLYTRLRSYFDYVRSVIPQWIANADGDLDDGEYQYDQYQQTRQSNNKNANNNNQSTVPLQRSLRATQLNKARMDYANYIFQTLTRGWEQKRPIWIMLLLNTLNENEFRYRGIPVLDLYLAQEALRRNKKTGAIERVEEQCVPLNRMNKSQIVFALNVTLSHLEFAQRHGRNMNESMLRAWRNPSEQLVRKYNCGNVRELVTAQQLASHALVSDLDDSDQRLIHEVDNYFADELLYKRNVKMAERVRHIMEYHPQTTFFFAFGAGHFVGNRTVLELLRSAGYAIEHVPVNKPPNAPLSHSRKKRNRTPRNVSIANRNARRRNTTPTPMLLPNSDPNAAGIHNQLPIDTWSLSFVEPAELPNTGANGGMLPQSRNGAANVASRNGNANAQNRNSRIGAGTANRNRAGGELLDYYSFWDNVLQQYVATSRGVPISRLVTRPGVTAASTTLLSTGIGRTSTTPTAPTTATTSFSSSSPPASTQVTSQARSSLISNANSEMSPNTGELFDLMRRAQPLRRRKMDESRVIDITDDENEIRRGRVRSNAASAGKQCDPGLLLSTCISIILTLCVIRYRRFTLDA